MLQRHILRLEAIPEFVDRDFAVRSLVRALRTGDGLAEAEEWQRKIDEAVLVLLDVCLSVYDLVEFQHHEAGDEGGGRGDVGDDFARDEIGFVSL